MADFKRNTQFEKYCLDRLTEAVRKYIVSIEKPNAVSRVRKVTMVFVGDRFRPDSIDVKVTKGKEDV